MKPLNAEPKRNDSIVPAAATASAPGTLRFSCMRNVLEFRIDGFAF